VSDFTAAADTLERLADAVESAAAEQDLTPAEVAREAGVPVATVLALHDGRDIALRSAAALLRWLGVSPDAP
jgi:predicted transcriptional regulator